MIYIRFTKKRYTPLMTRTIARLTLFLLIVFVQTIEAKGTQNNHNQQKIQQLIEDVQKDLPPQCIFFFKMYLNAKPYKSFAIASEKNNKYTCRFSSQASSQKKADEVALNSCEKSRKKREIKGECELYKVDVSNLKSNKRLSFEEKYLINLKKIKAKLKKDQGKLTKISDKKISKVKKEHTKKSKQEQIENIDLRRVKSIKKSSIDFLPKPCHMFYKLYKDAPSYKAFAFAQDSDKKYVCKFSAKSDSLDKAKQTAIYSCRKTKLKRKVQSECKLFELIYSHKIPAPKKKRKPTTSKKSENKKIIKPTLHKKSSIYDEPLKEAILSTNLRKIKKYINLGANVDTVAQDRSRALFVAVAKGDITFTKELLKKGAFPYFRTNDGNNLLVAAIMSGKAELLELMLKLGISPNKRCEEGNTPLHFAFMMFDDKMMRLLYRYNAQDDIKNNKGKTVQELAKELNFNLKKIKRSIYR